jgi:hypothetical protein
MPAHTRTPRKWRLRQGAFPPPVRHRYGSPRRSTSPLVPDRRTLPPQSAFDPPHGQRSNTAECPPAVWRGGARQQAVAVINPKSLRSRIKEGGMVSAFSIYYLNSFSPTLRFQVPSDRNSEIASRPASDLTFWGLHSSPKFFYLFETTTAQWVSQWDPVCLRPLWPTLPGKLSTGDSSSVWPVLVLW